MKLLEELEAAGVRLWLDARGLGYDGPEDVITAEVLEQMKRHRAQLVLALVRRKVQEYPPVAKRTSGRPYIGPATERILAQYLTEQEIRQLKEGGESYGQDKTGARGMQAV